jgi:hypothetical protein
MAAQPNSPRASHLLLYLCAGCGVEETDDDVESTRDAPTASYSLHAQALAPEELNRIGSLAGEETKPRIRKTAAELSAKRDRQAEVIRDLFLRNPVRIEVPRSQMRWSGLVTQPISAAGDGAAEDENDRAWMRGKLRPSRFWNCSRPDDPRNQGSEAEVLDVVVPFSLDLPSAGTADARPSEEEPSYLLLGRIDDNDQIVIDWLSVWDGVSVKLEKRGFAHPVSPRDVFEVCE